VYAWFWWGNARESDHLEDPGIDGKIILRWIFRNWEGGGLDWFDLAQGRDSRRTLVNEVTVPQNAGNFLIS
jgi:hypothetical protein